MTSQVNPNNIDGTYPVAGQDNDSQGFRDNFTNIRNNLTFAKAEIEDLQNKVVLKSALLNTTLDNDFAGNAIVNPTFTGYRETYNNIGAVTGAVTITFANGNFQKITMAGSTTLTFSFPASSAGQYASVKLWVSNPNASYTLTLPSSVTLGDPDTIAGLTGTSPPVIAFSSAEIANNTEYLFEFFTVDGGTTIGIRDLVRNRDIDLSGFSITGSLSVDSLTTTSGNITSGVDLVATGNVWAQAGHFRSSASTVYLANSTPTTGYLLGSATQIWVGALTGNVTVAGNVIANSAIRSVGNVVSGGEVIATNGLYSTGAFGGGYVDGTVIDYTTGLGRISVGSADSLKFYQGGPALTESFVIAATTGNVVVPATTTSTSTTTGALVVGGGTGIAGNVVTSGNIITTGTLGGGRINQSYAYVTLTAGQMFFANTSVNTLYFDTASSATIANAWIALPSGAEDGREIMLSFLAPITAVWVAKGPGGSMTNVKWYPNTSVASGNVSAKFTYSVANSNWLRS